MAPIDYETVIGQLKSELKTNSAIANRYGIILASNIDSFAKNKIIPQKILELISKRKSIATELNLNQINSVAFEAQEFNYLFTLSEELILISRVSLDINLALFMPSIRMFIQKLNESYIVQEKPIKQFSIFDFSKDIAKIESSLKNEDISNEKYSIIKELVKFISSK